MLLIAKLLALLFYFWSVGIFEDRQEYDEAMRRMQEIIDAYTRPGVFDELHTRYRELGPDPSWDELTADRPPKG